MQSVFRAKINPSRLWLHKRWRGAASFVANAAAIVATTYVLFIGMLAPALAHEPPTAQPLGDGKISTTPRRGFVMACQSRFPGGGGAHRVGEWIAEGKWDRNKKPNVEGDVGWPSAAISITVEGGHRIVRANNLPKHSSGEFPIKSGTVAYTYDRNPNHIGEQSILIRLPALPQIAEKPSCVPMGMIGFANSGVAIFNAFDLGGRDAPAYEIQDRCNGHPEVTRQYHYHDWSPCLSAADADEPVGWMLDGFPILGPKFASGQPVTNADLDECHGRVGPVLIDGQRIAMYHYRFTLEYPYTVGCFLGTPNVEASQQASAPFWQMLIRLFGQ
jgi:hypothetical protein